MEVIPLLIIRDITVKWLLYQQLYRCPIPFWDLNGVMALSKDETGFSCRALRSKPFAGSG